MGTGGTAQGGTTADACTAPVQLVSPRAVPPPVTQADFEARFPALVCAASKPCCELGSTSYSEAACLAFAAGEALDRSRLFDPIEASLCLQGLEGAASSCAGGPAYRGLPGPCNWTYRGDIQVGEECEVSSECAPDPRGRVSCTWVVDATRCELEIRGKLGDYCHEGCEMAVDSGVCHLLNDREDPAIATVCFGEDGLRCDWQNGCLPNYGAGCPCSFSDGDCDHETHCSAGLDAVCEPRSGVGEPCGLDGVCQLGLGCDDHTVCFERAPYGEPCEDHWECVGGFCYTGVCGLDNGEGRADFRDAFCDGIGS
jgi:hypothetical protein